MESTKTPNNFWSRLESSSGFKQAVESKSWLSPFLLSFISSSLLLHLLLSSSSDPAGELWWIYCDRPSPWRHPVSEGRWEEGVETTLLHAEGVRHLLCSQRKDKGRTHVSRVELLKLRLCTCCYCCSLLIDVQLITYQLLLLFTLLTDQLTPHICRSCSCSYRPVSSQLINEHHWLVLKCPAVGLHPAGIYLWLISCVSLICAVDSLTSDFL